MNEWDVLKSVKMDRCTISIYRSNAALHKWMVEANYQIGESSKLVFTEEKPAYKRYYEALLLAVKWESEVWDE